MADFIANTLIQALTFGIAGLGAAVAFRVVRYPDLTADGSFMLGAAVFASMVSSTGNWVQALLLATLAGAIAGGLTSILNARFGVSRLLSGIITTMAAYSVAFRFLGGRPNAGLAIEHTMFAAPSGVSGTSFTLLVAALFASILGLGLWHLLRSQLGLLLRLTGTNPALVTDLGRSPAIYRVIGLSIGNGLIGLSAALVSAQQGFADINLGVGVVVTLIAALVLGEQIISLLPGGSRARIAPRTLGPFIGAAAYFALFLLALKASIEGWIPFSLEPTDLKIISAVLLVLVVAFRRNRWKEEVLPL